MHFGGRSIADTGKPAVAASVASASAIARDPVGSLCAFGIAAQRAERHQLALALIGRAIMLDPGRAHPQFVLGRMLHQAGQLANATARYARVIELEPTHAEAHMNLGIVLNQQGRLDAAAAIFQRTLRLRPDDADALHNIAAVHCARGDPARALGPLVARSRSGRRRRHARCLRSRSAASHRRRSCPNCVASSPGRSRRHGTARASSRRLP
jgi:Flp pilus assembly protein TadD